MLPGIYSIFQHWGEQTIWIYSDPHFGDKDLDVGICGRPSTEEQIASINSCAGRKDTLIILGDVGDIEAVRKLRAGRKILIMGNHDAGRTNYEREKKKLKYDIDKYTKKEVKEIVEKEYPNWKCFIEEEFDEVHAPFVYWAVYLDNNLFDEIYEGALIVGEKLILSHEPIDIPWAFNIHGHIHDKKIKNDKTHTNVCSDVIGYKPLNFNQWLKQGHLAGIDTIHRITINKATKRKKKREKTQQSRAKTVK